jgi:hypothetical protein
LFIQSHIKSKSNRFNTIAIAGPKAAPNAVIVANAAVDAVRSENILSVEPRFSAIF